MRLKKRSISARSSSKTTSIAHNNRTLSDRGKLADYDDHIHWDRTSDNKILVDEPIKDAYRDLFSDAVDAYNAKQKRKDRRIKGEDGYFSKVNKSKGLDKQRELIVQFGTKDDDPIPMAISDEMFKDYLDSFRERYPDLHVYNASVHNDESTAHMHMNFIPVAEGYKTGMSKRPSFRKVLDAHHITFKDFFEREREDLASIMLHHTHEMRQKVGTHSYIPPQSMREMGSEADAMYSDASSAKTDAESLRADASSALTSADSASSTLVSSASFVLTQAKHQVKRSESSLAVREHRDASAEKSVQALASDASSTYQKTAQMFEVLERGFEELDARKQAFEEHIKELTARAFELLNSARDAIAKNQRDSVASEASSIASMLSSESAVESSSPASISPASVQRSKTHVQSATNELEGLSRGLEELSREHDDDLER